ncbi:hypothetical protein FDP41_004316 [Naegleria fowleri]|uniref:DUF4116 domain-containing protein n=1 Tax=Naegleria fowleri TaxID=5763 RepID=A0A6A5BHM7_NAEFO|nr:uncharacterized protein FDP41_004316 [Naegleria fowleri]KAF0976417.1 hypothetical protein FDP41_004316 [Naegleria fowleri]
MKRRLSGHQLNNIHHWIETNPTNKHLKLPNNTITDQVKIILINFHQSPFSPSSLMIKNHHQQQQHSLISIENTSHINHLYELLKRKFENQSKGFSKWLFAREQWLQCHLSSMKIEFINDFECVHKWTSDHDELLYENDDWLVSILVQMVDIRKLLFTNSDEQFHSVEFWKPFQEEIWHLLMKKQLSIMKYIPKEVFLEFNEWKEKLAHLFQTSYGLNFVFDLDDIDKAMKALDEKKCQIFQLSEGLRDNEQVMKYATQCDPKNIRYASERLKKDRKFCLDVVSSNFDSFFYLKYWMDDESFAFELLCHSSDITIVDGKIQQEQIQTCIPEICEWISSSAWKINLSMDDKMKIFQQLFLKDSTIPNHFKSIKNLMKSALQKLLELPEEYYQALRNHQHTLRVQGKFARSLFEQNQNLQNDRLVEQVLTRIYKNYDQIWMKDEKFILKRQDLHLLLKYGPMTLRRDRNFVLQVVNSHFLHEIRLENILPELQNDREIVLAVMTKNGRMFSNVFALPKEFLNDKEIILTALKSNHPCSFSDIPQNFHQDKDLILEILNLPIGINVAHDIDHVFPIFVERKDQEVIFAALKKDPKYWDFLSDDLLRNDRDFLLAAIRNNVEPRDVLYFASKELKQDATFMMEVVKAHQDGLNSILYSKGYTFLDDKSIFLNSEIGIEGVKVWGIISGDIFNVCLNRRPTDVSFDGAIKFFQVLKQVEI